jgi:predicted enzyme related to lactoylglutathione lyase
MNQPIAHFDIAGPDHAALTSFYSGLLDWRIQPAGPGYALAETGSVRGALVEAERAGVTLGVTVPDLDAALVRAAELGGTVEMPATDNGWVTKALVRDPAGNVLSLIQG